MSNRASGILMHISSLPSKYGIGDFGVEAFNFVDFLVKAKQKYWQILPLGMTGYGDSPYQSFSVYAGNPYFIDLDELIKEGFISDIELCEYDFGSDTNYVDYGKLYINKMALLRRAYKNSREKIYDLLTQFYGENKIWLREFSLYMTIKESNNNISWRKWPQGFKFINSQEVTKFEKENQESIYFWVFTQYFFMKQWLRLKEYANINNIKIIGDLPIYTAEDSADTWANPHIFKLNEDLSPITVSGCPPDGFTETGQLWGNPVYNWDALEDEGYYWWIQRIKHSFKLYDSLRMDHFRGFDAYWEVKYGEETAVNGRWTKGPSMKLFNKVKEELGQLDIIAEDLGVYTEGLGRLLVETNFPNMKVLQFAFDTSSDNKFLPHNYDKNCVVYVGTHDNHTAKSWIERASIKEVDFAKKYLNLNKEEVLSWGLIRAAWASVANLAIGQMQDFLDLGIEARMNEPGTLGENWKWRINKTDLSSDLSERIADLTDLYGR